LVTALDDSIRSRAARATVSGGARLVGRLVRELARADRRRLRWAFAVTLVGSALTGVFPILIGNVVSHALGKKDVSIVGSALPLAVILLVVLVQQVLQVVRRQLVENVATGLERDVRTRAYDHLLLDDIDRIRHGQVGGIYGQVNRGIEGAVKLLKITGLDVAPAVLGALAAVAAAFSQNLFVAVVMVGVIPTGFLFVMWQVRNQAGIRVQLRDHKTAIDGQVVELLPVLETVRAVGAHRFFSERIAKACGRLRETEFAHHRAMSLFDFGKALNEALWLVAVLVAALAVAPNTHTGAGQLLTYLMLFNAILQPLRDLHRILDETTESASAAADLYDVLDAPIDVGFTTPATLGTPANTRVPIVAAHGLSFGYRDTLVLNGLDLTIARGERVGIVGLSGCGKSTLLKLIRRFHHGYGGAIELLGRDLGTFSHDELVNVVGYVAQKPSIFLGSILENITLGRDADLDEVREAARRAQIDNEILAMPAGYDTLVGERGDTISGGQSQRICLARMLLRSPQLLLLDEPTSALDATAEHAVQAAIDALDDVTMIVVAHRLTTLENVDRIVVLTGGQIADEGTFAELARRPGLFRELLNAGDQTRRLQLELVGA
jgi:ATP-binding cassette, subfamily B, bacterial